MTKVNANTQKGRFIIWDFENARFKDIFDAYDRPSSTKVKTFNEIKNRALQTAGYNHDLRVAGRGTRTYSTVYSFTDENGTHIVKDTKSNTFIVTI